MIKEVKFLAAARAQVELGFSGAEIRIAVEDCIVDGSDVTTDGVIENLRRLKMLREVIIWDVR